MKDNQNYAVFNFLHQTHKARFSAEKNSDKVKHPFDAIEKYNEEYRELFMKNDLCSRMFYFVYKNYLVDYTPCVKNRYQKEIIIKV